MIYILAVRAFFKTEKVNFVYIDLKNKDEVKISCTPELAQEYEMRLLQTLEQINTEEVPNKKKDCKCEYSCVCF